MPRLTEQDRQEIIRYNPSLTEKARENRKTPTPAENKLWFEVLQDKRLAGLKFTRQKPLDEYIVDSYCAELMVAIEIDGDSHIQQADYDRQRIARLSDLGIELIRYANRDIMTNLTGAYQDLSRRIGDRRNQPPKSPLSGGLSARGSQEGAGPFLGVTGVSPVSSLSPFSPRGMRAHRIWPIRKE